MIWSIVATALFIVAIYNSETEKISHDNDIKIYAKNMTGFLDDFITFCRKLDEASSSSRCPKEGIKYYTDMRNDMEQKYLK